MTDSIATASPSVPSQAPATRRPRGLASARYYTCLATLVFFAAGMQALATVMGVHFRKDAVPLKSRMDHLDWNELAPRYQQHLIQPEPMDEEMVQQLGTDEYLQVRLVDTQRSREDATRVANVFITYYTGQPDLVPHVPDECYLAGGYDSVSSPETISVSVPGAGAPDDEIPVRMLQFRSPQRDSRVTVMYFFHANGEYRATRDGLRWLFTTDPLERYAYYAKIEVTFTGDTRNQRRAQRADKEVAVEAIEPLLRKLMPLLLADHFAWDRVVSDEWGIVSGRWVQVQE